MNVKNALAGIPDVDVTGPVLAESRRLAEKIARRRLVRTYYRVRCETDTGYMRATWHGPGAEKSARDCRRYWIAEGHTSVRLIRVSVYRVPRRYDVDPHREDT